MNVASVTATRAAVLAMALLATLLNAACTVIGVRSGTEEPPFAVRSTLEGGVEIRDYGPRLAAETAVPATANARNSAFTRLAGYIFGGNRAAEEIAMTVPVATRTTASEGTRIAMTAPVATADQGDTLVMRFYLPEGLTLATAPLPDDPTVRLVEVPPETLAVARFSGRPTEARIGAESKRLLEGLARAGIEPRGQPVAFFYDPPWTIPPLRRNEVAVPVDG